LILSSDEFLSSFDSPSVEDLAFDIIEARCEGEMPWATALRAGSFLPFDMVLDFLFNC